MKRNIKFFASALAVAALGVSLSACTDWTEPESLDQNYTPIEEAEGYAEYCAKVKQYHQTSHRQVYGWFNNVDNANGHGQRIVAMPDSLDVIVLANPATLSSQTREDMATVRDRFGIKFSYTVDFDAIKEDHTALIESIDKQIALLDASAEDYQEQLDALQAQKPEFLDYVLGALTEQLAYSNDFEGVMFAFDGKLTAHMRPAELTEYRNQMRLFLGAVKDYAGRHPELMIDYLGNPQYIADTEYIGLFKHLFVRPTLYATNANQYGEYYTLALTDGVPADRVGVVSTCTIPGDAETGYFADKSKAIDGFVKWAAGSPVAAVGVYNANYDYYNAQFTFPAVRKLIQAVNPAIK